MVEGKCISEVLRTNKSTKGILVFFLLMLVFIPGHAQQAFESIKGKILIKGLVGDSVRVAQSDQLVAVIDYERSTFRFKLEKSKIKTGIEELDSLLLQKENEFIGFNGSFHKEKLNIRSEEQEDFTASGYLVDKGENQEIMGSGNMYYLSDVYTCIMHLTFDICLTDHKLDLGIPGLSDQLVVEVVLTILDRNNQNKPVDTIIKSNH